MTNRGDRHPDACLPMKKEILFSLLFVVSVAVRGQPSLDQLESELSSTTGPARIELLVQLTEAYRRDDPQRALTLGSEALELLASSPDQNLKLEVLSSLADAGTRSEDFEAVLEYGTQAEALARTMEPPPALSPCAIWARPIGN